jgi:restriction system protein
MARRKKKTSPLEDLLTLSSKLPWYIGVGLALLSYIIFSQFAVKPEIANGGGVAVVSGIFFPQIIFILSSFAQYLLPLIFCIAAVTSFVKSFGKEKELPPSLWVMPKNNTVSGSNGPTGITNKPSPWLMPKNNSVSSPNESAEIANKPSVWSLDFIKSIEWRVFEKLAVEYFKAKNYEVEETGAGKDGGVDFYLFQPSVNEDKSLRPKPFSAIQCKSWLTRKVDVKTVRELYGVMAAESITLGAVVASGDFTDDALSFAKDKHVQLISGSKFLGLIKDLPVDTQNNLLEKIISGDYTTPTCPSCDIKLVARTSKKGKKIGSSFWGCSNFPSCRYKLRSKVLGSKP